MPDDEVETIEEEEEEDETKEDIEVNTPPVETKPKPVDYSKHWRQFLHVWQWYDFTRDSVHK